MLMSERGLALNLRAASESNRFLLCDAKITVRCGINLGYWRQTADKRVGNPPRGNQEPLVIKDKVGRPQLSSGPASLWNVIFSPSMR